MPNVKKNNINISKGKLFERKGLIMKEEVELEFSKDEIDFAQICVESKRWCKPGKNDTMIVCEEKKLWLSADAFLSSPTRLSESVDVLEQSIRYAEVDKDKNKVKDLKMQLKNVKKMLKEGNKLIPYGKAVSKVEFEIREKKLKGEK